MADNIRDGLQIRKRADSGEQELRESINTAATKAMKKFIQRLDNDEIPIDNMSDVVRVLGVYKEINNIEGMMEGSNLSNALPEVNMSRSAVIEAQVGEITESEDGEERIDVTQLTTEDMTKLLENLDREQNKENERSF